MTALALFLLLCWFSTAVITAVAGLRTFRDEPMSLNRDENVRRMHDNVMTNWGAHLKWLEIAQGLAGILLALVVLLG